MNDNKTSHTHGSVGVLVINLGTPSAPDTSSVRRYLKQFLSDPAVITLPGWARWLLLRLVILPFRSPKSAKAYQSIWTEEGSPLMVHSRNFVDELQRDLPGLNVVLGMRYGEPSISSALEQLAQCQKIIVIPMYPQFANATTQSTIDEVERCFKQLKLSADLVWIRDFYAKTGFASTIASLIDSRMTENLKPHILMSYHGLPKSQLSSICGDKSCFKQNKPCAIDDVNSACYRMQCYHTSYLIAKALDLSKDQYSIAFQSRLGANAWIQPYTDKSLESLLNRGIKNILVVCPAFVSDCIETLEEIAMELKEQWLEMGGDSLSLVPCLNAEKVWVKNVSGWVQEIL
ncbi:MAG: ferrochelatase [Coxiellaceae bacterium]|nr:ferrochelatase [Coxiellaceae bacterium]|tara:strand:+ start:1367 stop:2401 length:1035 start_codon:yes stop_codon:yes gene_type:complete